MRRLIDHARGLWGAAWWVPGVAFSAYCAVLLSIGGLRFEHVGASVAVIASAYVGPRSKQFLIDMSPYVAVGIGYDSVRYIRAAVLTADRVWACGLRDFDAALFPGPGGVSAQEWLVQHHSPFVDVLSSGPYAFFAYVAFLYAGYLYFVDRPRARHYLWAFAIANYISFAMWLLVPAAPPWYVREFGCTIDLSALPSAAALLRVDEYFGMQYFASFYSRTTSVFGAMPSMHNAYPILGLLTAWSSISWKTKPIHILYLLWMFFASLYLDHHWVVDAIAGWLVALVAVNAARPLVRHINDRDRATRAATPAGVE